MWKAESLKKRSLNVEYKTILKSLLSMPRTSVDDIQSNCNMDSKTFEDGLQRLLAQGLLALEKLQSTAYEIQLSTLNNNNVPQTGGFDRLAAECHEFLKRFYKRNESNGKNSIMNMNQLNENKLTQYISERAKLNCDQEEEEEEEGRSHSKQSGTDHSIPSVSVGKKVSCNSPERLLFNGTKTDIFKASRCLAGLITLTESKSFETLLTSICFKGSKERNRNLELLILESILETNGIRDPVKLDLRNLSLTFGETPLLLALRARDSDVVLALLRHGADVNKGWMGLENALQVLLFSPNQILLEPQDIAAVEKCLEYLLLMMRTVDLEAMTSREKEGYYALHPEWQTAVRLAMESTWRTDSIPVPSLQHLCRCTIRSSMKYLGHRLPDGLHHLPLPGPLKQFLSI